MSYTCEVNEKITGNPRHFRRKALLKPKVVPTIFFLKALTAKTRQHTVTRIKQKEITCLILLINYFSDITITGITLKYC